MAGASKMCWDNKRLAENLSLRDLLPVCRRQIL